MQFLKTLFWVILAVILVLFAKGNWTDVTLRLWGGLEADVKLPVLLLTAFLLGLLPTWLLHRARLWSLKRRLEPLERNATVVRPPAAAPAAVPAAPAVAPAGSLDDEARVATDSKAWPTP